MSRRSAAIVAASVGCWLPLASAQDAFFVPTLEAGVAYDDNPRSSAAADPEDDFLLRVTPTLAGGWRGPRGELRAMHTFDAERYHELDQFDDLMARRHTALDLDYALDARTRVAGSLATSATNSAGDIAPELGLELGRVEAERHSAELEFERRMTERMSLTAGAGWSRDDVAAGAEPDTDSLVGSVGGKYRANERHAWTGEYLYRRFDFDAPEPIESHVALFGWETELSPRTSLTVQAGPRYTDGDTSPEVHVGATYGLVAGSVSLNYAHTQSTVVGQAGPADSQSAWLAWRHSPSAELSLSLSPSWSRLERDGLSVEVLRVFTEARYLLTRRLSLVGNYRWTEQDGSLESAGPFGIDRNVIYVGVLMDFYPQPANAEETRREQ